MTTEIQTVKTSYIDFPGNPGHWTIVGTTQHGKSHAIFTSLKQQPKGAIFFNSKREEKPFMKGWIEASAEKNTKEQILKALNQGKKINYMPFQKLSQQRKELQFLIDYFFAKKDKKQLKDIYIVIDEVNTVTKGAETTEEVERLAHVGLGLGLTGIFIGQRFAEIPNSLFSMSENKAIFHVDQTESEYFKRKGLPYDEISKKVLLDQYAYVIYRNGELKGAYKV